MKATQPKKDRIKVVDSQFDFDNDNNDSVEYKPYLIEYEYNGQAWGSEIYATSLEEATHKLKAMSQGIILGERKMKAYIPIQYKWLTRLRRWIQSIL